MDNVLDGRVVVQVCWWIMLRMAELLCRYVGG